MFGAKEILVTTTIERNDRRARPQAARSRYRRMQWEVGVGELVDFFAPITPSRPRSSRVGTAPSQQFRRVLDIRAGGVSRRVARPLVRHGLIRFSSDRVHKAAIEALAGGFHFIPNDPDHRTAAPDMRPKRAFLSSGGKDRLEGNLGFRRSLTDRERELLSEQRAQLIKLQFALWARAFAETDADPSRPAVVTLSQLCEDLGYRRLQNGAHRPEHKRQVAEWVELLTAIELEGEYCAPDGRRVNLHGPLWRRFRDWEGDRVIAFAPGPWYADPVWSRFNRRVGLIGAGLLSLRPDRDRWAISAGAYLATLARMNGYRTLTLRVATLIERTGLEDAEQRNPSRMREMLERALEQLEAAGVIAQWDWFNADTSEPDMDAPRELMGLTTSSMHWTERSLVIRWPAQLHEREGALRSKREPRGAGPRVARSRTVPQR